MGHDQPLMCVHPTLMIRPRGSLERRPASCRWGLRVRAASTGNTRAHVVGSALSRAYSSSIARLVVVRPVS